MKSQLDADKEQKFWFALQNKDLSTLEVLINEGININIIYQNGKTPLHLAADSRDSASIKLLLEHGAEVNIKDNDDETPLFYCARKGDSASVKLLLEHKAEVIANKFNYTPLHYAAISRRSASVQLLLEHGAEVNIVNQDGNTPLLYAAWGGDSASIKLLLEHGAEVNIVNPKGETPLHAATSGRDSASVKLLLEHGAEVNIVNQDGNTPLLYAAWEGVSASVKLLLEHGAEVNKANPKDDTPLRLAASKEHSDSVKLLLAVSSSQEEREQLWNDIRHKSVLDASYDANAKVAFFKEAAYLHHLLHLAIPVEAMLKIAANAARANMPEDMLKEMITLSSQEGLNACSNLPSQIAFKNMVTSHPKATFAKLPYPEIKATVGSMVNFARTAKDPFPYLPKDITATIASYLSPSVPLDLTTKRQIWGKYVRPILHSTGTKISKNLLLPITECSEKIPQKIQQNFNEALGENGERNWQDFIESKKQQLAQQRS